MQLLDAALPWGPGRLTFVVNNGVGGVVQFPKGVPGAVIWGLDLGPEGWISDQIRTQLSFSARCCMMLRGARNFGEQRELFPSKCKQQLPLELDFTEARAERLRVRAEVGA